MLHTIILFLINTRSSIIQTYIYLYIYRYRNHNKKGRGETHNKSQKVGSIYSGGHFQIFFNNPPPQKKNVYGIIVRLYLLSLPLFSFGSSLSRRESDIMFSLTLYKSKKGLKSPPLTHSFQYICPWFFSLDFSHGSGLQQFCVDKNQTLTQQQQQQPLTHTVAVKHHMYI